MLFMIQVHFVHRGGFWLMRPPVEIGERVRRTPHISGSEKLKLVDICKLARAAWVI